MEEHKKNITEILYSLQESSDIPEFLIQLVKNKLIGPPTIYEIVKILQTHGIRYDNSFTKKDIFDVAQNIKLRIRLSKVVVNRTNIRKILDKFEKEMENSNLKSVDYIRTISDIYNAINF